MLVRSYWSELWYIPIQKKKKFILATILFIYIYILSTIKLQSRLEVHAARSTSDGYGVEDSSRMVSMADSCSSAPYLNFMCM